MATAGTKPSNVVAWLSGLVLAFAAGAYSAQTDSKPTADVTASDGALSQRVSSLETRVNVLEAASATNTRAYLDLTTPAYERVDSDAGTFFVSVVKVEPYLDGQKITLHIGNPTAATFNGFTMHFIWGAHKKDDNSTASLVPGTWTTVTTVLAPAKPEDLKLLAFEIETNQISLR